MKQGRDFEHSQPIIFSQVCELSGGETLNLCELTKSGFFQLEYVHKGRWPGVFCVDRFTLIFPGALRQSFVISFHLFSRLFAHLVSQEAIEDVEHAKYNHVDGHKQIAISSNVCALGDLPFSERIFTCWK